jgi:hypothetical protein
MNEETIKKYILHDKKVFNNFKTIQARKYYLYAILNKYFLKGSDNYNKPFIIEKYKGSNQVILYENEKEIYNSETDNFKVNDFIDFVIEIVLKVYKNGVV